MNKHHRFRNEPSQTAIEIVQGKSSLGHALEILNDSSMTSAQKRETLASWASDARAPADRPTLRKLDNGAVIHLKDILHALRKLDDDDDPPPSPASMPIAADHLWQAEQAA